MFDVALSVVSCLRADTGVHVAWLVDPTSRPDEAVAITPGGGRMGSLMGGAFDHAIAEAVARMGPDGELLETPLGPVEALITGKPEGTVVTVAVVPGELLGLELWSDIAARLDVRFGLQRHGSRLSDPERLESGPAGTELTETVLITSLVAVPSVVISGSGPIAEAVAAGFGAVDWRSTIVPDVAAATGLMATLSHQDAVVVMGHDVESSTRALGAAIASNAGYIASLGGRRMQEARRERLAYQGIEWDERVRGPAGIPIGAETPAEIAVSIVAEAISAHRRGTGPSD